MALFLTYDNSLLDDGFGAQALRILGVYSIARKFRCKYIHSDISYTVEEFSHGVESEQELNLLKDQVNLFFRLPSSRKPKNFDREIAIKAPSLKEFLILFFKYRYSRQNVLLRICLPFRIIDRNPDLYKLATAEIINNNLKAFRNHVPPEMVVHIRMSHGRRNVPDSQPARHLPISFFQDVLRALLSKGTNEKIGRAHV